MTSNSVKNRVVLVDINDNPLGTMEKMEAHRKGAMHRAVSVLVFNTQGEWLLHQRAKEKYHAGGLWTNACCTHPFEGEAYEEVACRRMREEMRMEISPAHLICLFDFTYKVSLNNNLIEHEYDRVFFYITDAYPRPNQQEVMDWKYLSHTALDKEIILDSESFTPWFKIIYQKALSYLHELLFLNSGDKINQ